jgi:hypothetical protein
MEDDAAHMVARSHMAVACACLLFSAISLVCPTFLVTSSYTRGWTGVDGSSVGGGRLFSMIYYL